MGWSSTETEAELERLEQPALLFDVLGRAQNLLQTAAELGLDDRTSYLRRLAGTAGGVVESIAIVQAELERLELPALLFGGDGLVTTGDYVDGRPTTPGLQTDCIPGVLRSDCSPAQEDGAWSKEAAEYIVRSLRPDG